MEFTRNIESNQDRKRLVFRAYKELNNKQACGKDPLLANNCNKYVLWVFIVKPWLIKYLTNKRIAKRLVLNCKEMDTFVKPYIGKKGIKLDDIDINIVLDALYDDSLDCSLFSICEFIEYIFPWDPTPEGFIFWQKENRKIHRALDNIRKFMLLNFKQELTLNTKD